MGGHQDQEWPGTGNKHLSVLPFLFPFLIKEESYVLKGTALADSGVLAPPSSFFQSSLSLAYSPEMLIF